VSSAGIEGRPPYEDCAMEDMLSTPAVTACVAEGTGWPSLADIRLAGSPAGVRVTSHMVSTTGELVSLAENAGVSSADISVAV